MILLNTIRKAVGLPSRYATMSVEEQGQALHEAVRKGTLDKFTPADWDVFIGSRALGWKDHRQRLFLHWAAIYGHLDQIPHPVWTALITQDLLKEKDDRQNLFLHYAVEYGYLDQIPYPVWTALITQDLLKEKDEGQMLFLHRAALKGSLDQIPHYVFNHMTSKGGYDEDFWLSKDSAGDNILDNAAYWGKGRHFFKALHLPLWQGRQAVLTTLWAEMKDKHKGRDGVREAYERFMKDINSPTNAPVTISVKTMSQSALAPLLKP